MVKSKTEEQKRKACEYQKVYRGRNREKVLARKKVYWDINKDERNAQKREHYQGIKDTPEVKKKRKAEYENNKEAAIKKTAEWRKNNPEKHKEHDKQYAERHKEELAARSKERYVNNKESIGEYYKVHNQIPEVKARRRLKDKENREANREKIAIRKKIWCTVNDVYLKEYHHQKYVQKAATIPGSYDIYRKNARRRNKDFGITIEEFVTFWGKPCVYCHSEILTVGIDRINNGIGYEMGNLVPCCPICNKFKLHRHTTESFISKCKKISAKHQ